MSEGSEKAVAKIPKVSSSLTSEIKEALNRISSTMEENFATIETKLDSLSTELQEVKSQLVNRGSNQPTIVVTGEIKFYYLITWIIKTIFSHNFIKSIFIITFLSFFQCFSKQVADTVVADHLGAFVVEATDRLRFVGCHAFEWKEEKKMAIWNSKDITFVFGD